MRKRGEIFITCLVLGINIFLSFNKHSKTGYFNYHSEIWGDKAGYHVYLPAAFNYGFKGSLFPDSIEAKTGFGFRLEEDKIITKYTYGVALMQLPFYLIANALSDTSQGFTPLHFKVINLASSVYLTLGLLLLFSSIKKRTSQKTAFLTCIVIYLTTNLFWYAVDETGMSHVYSFFLFSAFLFLADQLKNNSHIFSLGFIIGLIILIRPINLLFIAAIVLFMSNKETQTLKRFDVKHLVMLCIPVILIIIPQLMYWKYTFNDWLYYSYGNEGFQWFNPKLLVTWFAPQNGLFLYTPLMLIALVAMIRMLKNKERKRPAVIFMSLFLILSYVLSCWWDPVFGCAFGARSFVEYWVLFSIPLAYLFQSILQLNKVKQICFWGLIIGFTTLNMKMVYSYDGCAYTQNYWDWAAFGHLLTSPVK